MDFRAPGQSNERRRRVRAEDSVAATLPIRRPARSDGEGPRYAERGHPERQPRLMDLVPRRRLWQNVVAAIGAVMAAALLAGHWFVGRASVAMPEAVVRLLDSGARDSLAAWTRSGMLAAAAAMAMLVYVVRRHRTDDYRGGYRIWLWAAAWMLAMSADAVAGLREACRAIGVAASQWSGPGDGVLWWIVPCGLAAAAIGVRLALDMRECRASSVWLGVATATWGVGEVLGHVGPRFFDALTSDVAAAGCSIFGQWFLFVAMSWHARHVVLDASGALRAKGKKKQKSRRRSAASGDDTTAASSSSDEPARRSEPRRMASAAASSSATTSAKPAATKSPSSSEDSTLAAKLTFGGRASNDNDAGRSSSHSSSQLSKAERKKLKREMRRAA